MDTNPNLNNPVQVDLNAPNVVDTNIDLVHTMFAITKEVGEMLNSIPYVKALSGVILQIIQIRDEIKANKERCREIIDKVLAMSQSIYDKLVEVVQSSNRDKLSKLEGYLSRHQSNLKVLYTVLEKHRSRRILPTFLNRGLGELDQIDRRLDMLNTQLTQDIVFHITMEQAASAPTANKPTPPTASEHILPPRPHLMVQREDQFTIGLEILLSAEPSRLAILGGGGFGKTTLARSILHHPKIAERYKSRYFLPCEGLADVDALLLGFGTLLGISGASSAVLPSARHILSKSITLLCLDNFETPWEPPATRAKIEDVLASIADIPNLSLIITMRGTQRPSKVTWSRPLPPLSTLSSDSAKEILQTICPNHAVDEFTLKLLNVIDGIPLAITLMANLFRDGETSKSLWIRWSKRQTHVIQTGGDDRELNLSTSIVLSVESHRMKRDPDIMTLLAALSLLPSGFPSDAETLAKLEEYLGIRDIISGVETLRTVSLVDSVTSTRIHMLSPIRLFCLGFLSSKISVVLEQVVNYYISILLNAGYDWDNAQFYAQVVPEIQNIHSAFQSVYTAGYSQDITRLIIATTYLTGWSDYIGYLSQITIQMALKISINFPILHADCLMSLGQLYDTEGHYTKAEKCFREAAQLFKQGGNSSGNAYALRRLGGMLYYMQRFDQAEVELNASLKTYIRDNNRLGEANVGNALGNLFISKGQHSAAEAPLLSALQAYTEMSELIGQANTTNSLAWLHFKLDNLVQAENFAIESLAIAREANYAVGEGNALGRLGRIYLRTDKLIDAKWALEQALTITKPQNHFTNQLGCECDLAEAYIQLDQLSAAEALLVVSAEVELDVIEIPIILDTLARVYIYGDYLEEAESYLKRALELFRHFGNRESQVEVLSNLGVVYLKSNRLHEAEEVLKSIPYLGVLEDIEMYRLWVLGDFYITNGQLDDAQTSFNSAIVLAQHRQSSSEQGDVLRSMGTLLVKRGLVDQAIDKFKEALEFHRKAQWISQQATDLKRLGEAYNILGNSDEAEAALKEAEGLMESVREIRMLKG